MSFADEEYNSVLYFLKKMEICYGIDDESIYVTSRLGSKWRLENYDSSYDKNLLVRSLGLMAEFDNLFWVNREGIKEEEIMSFRRIIYLL